MKAICLCLLLALALPAPGNAQEFGVGIGASRFSGRFGGTERSEIDSVYITANASTRGWRLDATLPYLRVNGAGTIDIGGIIVPVDELGPSKGVGDLTVRVTRSAPEPFNLPLNVAVAAQVKLPTGAAAVSTGRADGAFDVEISRDIDSFSPFLTIGYRVLGDLSYLPLKDGWSFSAGTGVTLGKIYINASYDWSQAAAGGSADPQEVLLLAAGPLGSGLSWSVLASKGLSSGAADFGFGAGITRSFGHKPVRPTSRPRL